ncbi:MAG: rhodanese-like domain-containing protein [Thiobacillus sp.]
MDLQFIQNNLLLVGLAVVSGAMLLWSFIGGKVSGVTQVDTLEATRLINQEALVLDVREDKEFVAGHIPKARHIPLSALASRLGELEKFKNKPVVVNCRSGQRSARACGILKKHGFEKVVNLAGGIMAWESAHLPVEKKS